MTERHKLPDEFHKIADYLAGEASVEECRILEQWLEEKPDNRVLFEKVKRVWQASELPVEKFQPDVSKAWEKIKPQATKEKGNSNRITFPKPEPEKSDNKIWFYAFAASITLILLTTISFFFIRDPNLIAKLNLEVKKVEASEKGEVLLADGSHVWLNSNSKLYYPESFDLNRTVYLEGEAYFQIRKDESKPFFIHSGKGLIKVLGTSFNVLDQSGKALTVTVTEGKVALFSGKITADSIVLVKGEKGILKAEDQHLQKSEIDDPNFLSWKTGILYFDSTPLTAVCEALSKHYQVEIVLKKSTQNCTLTSTFNNKSLDEILEVIDLTMRVNIEKEKDKVTIVELGCF